MAQEIYEQEANHARIHEIMNRFKCTRDLHTYLTDHCGYLLPKLNKCKLVFLQGILYGTKCALRQRDVPAKSVPNWPQLSVKSVLPQVYDWEGVKEHLPDWQQDQLPEREFFWRVLYGLYPDRVEIMISQAAAQRMPKQTNLQDQKWRLLLKPQIIDELLKYDFVSTKKGRGASSIVFSQVSQARTKKDKRRKVAEDQMIFDCVSNQESINGNERNNNGINIQNPRKNNLLEEVKDNQGDQIPSMNNSFNRQNNGDRGMSMSARATMIMNKAKKMNGSKKRSHDDFMSQGIVEVEKVMNDSLHFQSIIEEKIGQSNEGKELQNQLDQKYGQEQNDQQLK